MGHNIYIPQYIWDPYIYYLDPTPNSFIFIYIWIHFQIHIYIFAPTEHWVFSGNLGFHKSSFIHGCLPGSLISRCSLWLRKARSSSEACTSSTAHTSVCLLLLSGPLVYGSESHNCHKDTFSYEWMPIFSCWRRDQHGTFYAMMITSPLSSLCDLGKILHSFEIFYKHQWEKVHSK